MDKETNTQTVLAVEEKAVKDEYVRGPNGVVGTATASLTIKQMWHQAHFQLVDIGDRTNPHRKAWAPMPGRIISLKQFARSLASKGDPTAKDWFGRKRGSMNAKRSDANVKIAMEAAAATRMSKRKKSQKAPKADTATTKK